MFYTCDIEVKYLQTQENPRKPFTWFQCYNVTIERRLVSWVLFY